jgi:hypothetical protein
MTWYYHELVNALLWLKVVSMEHLEYCIDLSTIARKETRLKDVICIL